MTKRDTTADILRGFGITLMIAGHIDWTFWPVWSGRFDNWIHAFHVPIFFIVAGFFFSGEGKDPQEFIAKKARQLILPYFFWGILWVLHDFLMYGDTEILRSDIMSNFILHPDNGLMGAIWFLPALFWMEAIYVILKSEIKNKYGFHITVIALGLIGMFAASKGLILPFALDSAIAAIPFMSFGELLRNKNKLTENLLHMKWYIFIPAVALNTYLIYFNGAVNFRGATYNNFALTLFNAFLATILWWNFSRVIAEKVGVPVIHHVGKIFASIGVNSMAYMCMNIRLIGYVLLTALMVPNETFAWQVGARLITLVVVIAACHIITMAILKSRLRWILGKK